MKLFADENIPLAIIRWLRDAGHDVASAAEVGAGEDDDVWLRRAEAEQRLLVTSDKDFGELVFRDRLNSYGVILLRLDGLSMAARVARLTAVWSVIEANPSGSFIVVSPTRVRSRGTTTQRTMPDEGSKPETP
jgi:predicted nuclease of predicted toxin-antitoxin system